MKRPCITALPREERARRRHVVHLGSGGVRHGTGDFAYVTGARPCCAAGHVNRRPPSPYCSRHRGMLMTERPDRVTCKQCKVLIAKGHVAMPPTQAPATQPQTAEG